MSALVAGAVGQNHTCYHQYRYWQHVFFTTEDNIIVVHNEYVEVYSWRIFSELSENESNYENSQFGLLLLETSDNIIILFYEHTLF